MLYRFVLAHFAPKIPYKNRTENPAIQKRDSKFCVIFSGRIRCDGRGNYFKKRSQNTNYVKITTGTGCKAYVEIPSGEKILTFCRNGRKEGTKCFRTSGANSSRNTKNRALPQTATRTTQRTVNGIYYFGVKVGNFQFLRRIAPYLLKD